MERHIEQDDVCTKCARAMVFIDKELLEMGDSYAEIVENTSWDAGIDIVAYDHDEERLDEEFLKAYTILVNEKPETIANYIKQRFQCDYDDRLEEDLKYENVRDIKDSNIYGTMSDVMVYLEAKNQSQEIISKIREFLDRIAKHDARTINIAYTVAHQYYKYLDKNLFGTLSNDCYTVGHTITKSDVERFPELKGYEYICHKDLHMSNGPKFDIAMLFKNDGDNMVIDFMYARKGYVAKNTVSIVGYYFDKIKSMSFPKDESPEMVAQELAKACDETVPEMMELADEIPELRDYVPLRTQDEKSED